jgi:MFS family permease
MGRRPTLLISLFLTATTMLALGFAAGFFLISIATLMVGFFTEMYRPAALAAIADVVPSEDRVRAYGLMYWAINLGAAVAPAIAGLLAARYYLAIFVGDALTTAAFGLLVLLRVPETRSETGVNEEGPEAAPDSRKLGALGDPILLSLTALSFVLYAMLLQGYVTLPVEMLNSGATEAQYGLVIALNGLVIALVQIPASGYLARFPRPYVLVAGAAVTGIGFGLTGWAGAVPLFALTVVIWTLGEIATTPVARSIVADLSPQRQRGAYQGVYNTSLSLASLAGPALGGLALERLGSDVFWPTLLAVGLLAALSYAALVGPTRRRLASQEAPGELSPSSPAESSGS